MGEHFFIKETSNKYKIKIFTFMIIFSIIVLGLSLAIVSLKNKFNFNIPFYDALRMMIATEVSSFTVAGLFILGFFGALFFVPVPQEAFFYYALLKGNPIFVSFLAINAGFFLSQIVNYYLGSFIGRFLMPFLPKKKMYSIRRFVNKNGAKGILIANILPLPAPLLHFALGITKYNVYRLSFYLLLGTVVKYSFIIGFFLLT